MTIFALSQEYPPIFFVHFGEQPLYLQAAMLQAKKSNPRSQIILLTDCPLSNKRLARLSGLVQLPIERYMSSASIFEQSYVHEGSNSYHYELRNFQRWFCVLEFLHAERCRTGFVYLDSDALLYTSVDSVMDQLESRMTVCNIVGPQFSFFTDVSALQEYCDFLIDVYQRPNALNTLENFRKTELEDGVPHISDMATLAYFGKSRRLLEIGDASSSDPMFDENIGLPQGVSLGLLGKKIRKTEQVRFFVKEDGKYVRAGGVHLQGGNKALWPLFVDRSVNVRLITSNPFQYAVEFGTCMKKVLHISWLRLAKSLKKIFERRH